MSDIVLTLPEGLAQEAKANGLLAPEFIISMLRAEIRRRRINRLFNAADRLAEAENPIPDSEIEAEIAASRNERKTHSRS
jgi:hypothetical protein